MEKIDTNLSDADILFLGGIFPKELESEVFNNTITNVDTAADNLQKKYLNGFRANSSNRVKIINTMFISSYPRNYKKIAIKSSNFDYYNEGNKDINVGFINLPGVKNVVKYLKKKKHLKSYAKDNTKDKIAFAYAMTLDQVLSLAYLKKKNSNIKTVLIVPDLPMYMNTTNGKDSFIRRNLKKIDSKIMNSNLKKVDKLVVLTQQMIAKIGDGNIPAFINEGMIDLDAECTKYQDNDNSIVYTGTLNEKYGVRLLVDAFNQMDTNDYKLVICGKGDSVSYIEEAARKNSNIIYKGQLPYNEIIKVQRSACLLVNPRPNDEEYVKYSFPSKIVEYLATGVITIAFKLDGIPDKYDEYLNYFSSKDAKVMADDIKALLELNMSTRIIKGNEAYEFVNKNLSPYQVCKNILEFIES